MQKKAAEKILAIFNPRFIPFFFFNLVEPESHETFNHVDFFYPASEDWDQLCCIPKCVTTKLIYSPLPYLSDQLALLTWPLAELISKAQLSSLGRWMSS